MEGGWSTYGIGEILVSGQVTDDLFNIADNGELVSSEITEKRVKLTRNGEWGYKNIAG